MPQRKQIAFHLLHISTPQFAIIEDVYQKDCETGIEAGVGVMANEKDNKVGIEFGVSFICKKNPFVKLSVQCEFGVDKNSFDSFKNNENKLVIPVGFCQHLAMLSAGTARGILFEKLKDTQFKDFILPTIDITQLLKEDIELERNDKK
ncbi:hypothetical protein ACFLU5_13490 [Bacteroidota bacterium]